MTTARPRGVIGILIVAAFVVILNETTMNVALSAIMEDFSVTERTAQWLTTAFMLTMAVVIPVTGWLLDRLSTRTVFVIAIKNSLGHRAVVLGNEERRVEAGIADRLLEGSDRVT